MEDLSRGLSHAWLTSDRLLTGLTNRPVRVEHTTGVPQALSSDVKVIQRRKSYTTRSPS